MPVLPSMEAGSLTTPLGSGRGQPRERPYPAAALSRMDSIASFVRFWTRHQAEVECYGAMMVPCATDAPE